MADEKQREVETCIHSVLTSNPLRMTIKDLDREFANMIGYEIPYKELGYNTLEAYLRSIPHRVVVNGKGYYAEVQVVVSEKSAHIDNLIRRQKVATTKKSLRCGLRKNVSIRQHLQQLGKKPTCDFPKYEPPTKANWERNPTCGTQPRNQSTPIKNDPSPTTLNPSLSPKVERLSERVSQVATNYHDGVSTRSVKRSPVPNYIKNRLKQIIVKYPEGLHCNQLPDLYKNQFGHNLNFFDYGYKSVAQLCMDLSGIFSYQRLKDSTVKVFDKDLGIELEHEPLEAVEVPRSTLNKNTEPALPLDVENILLDFHYKHLSKDVVINASIVRQWIGADVGLEDYIDLVVGEVYDPSKFWIQLLEHTDALNQLMDRMQLFYRDKQGAYDIPPYAIKDDMYLACMFEGEYHRAKVIESLKKREGKLKVFYIDYGTVAVVQPHGLCYLIEDFAVLPAQAIRARLYGVQPPERDSPWPRAASARFLSWVFNKALVGQVYDIDEEEMILDLVIADTSNPNRDVFLNDRLVHEELAVFSDEETHEPKPRDFEPTVTNVYLYPTHKDLEEGQAPTYQAMFYIDASNLSYDKILPKYFRSTSEGVEKSDVDEESVGSKENLSFGDAAIVSDTVEIVSETESSASSEPNLISPISSKRPHLRPPPGIHINSDNQVYAAAVANASMYFANMIAGQTMLNAMAMANPYYQNYCYPYHEPSPYTLPYNMNPYNTPLPAYKPYDPAFYPTQPPRHYKPQLHWPPPPNFVDEYHQTYPHLTQHPPSVEYEDYQHKGKLLNRLSPIDHSQNDLEHFPQYSLKNQECYSILHRLNIEENVVINQPERITKNNTVSPENMKSFDQTNTHEQSTINDKNSLPKSEEFNSVVDNLEVQRKPKNTEGLLLPENTVKENPLRLASLSKNEEVRSKSTINNSIQEAASLENMKDLLHLDKAALHNKIEMEDIKDTEIQMNFQEENEVNVMSRLFENLSLGNNPDYIQPDLESSTVETESQEEMHFTNLSSTTVQSLDNKPAVKVFRTSIELKIEDSTLVDSEVTTDVVESPENTKSQKRVSLESIGGTNVHVITMCDNEKYFMLREITLRLFESLRPESARRLIAASPYLIDIDDIHLGHYVELKTELLREKIIADTENKIDVFPVDQFPDIVRAVYGETPTRQCDDFVKDLNNFVKRTK